MQASFTVKTKELKTAFQKLFSYKKRTASSIITIVIEPDLIELKVSGITQRIVAEGKSMADVTLPANIFWAYLQTASSATLSFTFKPGQLKSGVSIYEHKAITVKPSPVERVSDIPLNLNPGNILRFAADKTPEELKNMKLAGRVQYAQTKLREAVNSAAELLKDYDVKYEDILKIIEGKGILIEN